jgi:hypothetical protein
MDGRRHQISQQSGSHLLRSTKTLRLVAESTVAKETTVTLRLPVDKRWHRRHDTC